MSQGSNKRVRRTYSELFLAELTKLSGNEIKFVNNRTLKEALDWDESRYDRVKEQLKDANSIVAGRGGPGGAVALAKQPGSKALTVFISYCHTDEKLKDALIKHLRPLERMNLISEWHDRKIEAGENWRQAISEKIESASIVLLLVSIDFINSNYCYGVEMDRALERNEKKDCVVIPIILRNCMWQHTPFAKLQALPNDAKPIVAWADEEEAFVSVAEGIKAVAERLLA